MGDFKSKLPDFQEVLTLGRKLLKDVQKSVGEIFESYKQKRAETTVEADPAKESTVEKTTAAPVEEAPDAAELPAKKNTDKQA